MGKADSLSSDFPAELLPAREELLEGLEKMGLSRTGDDPISARIVEAANSPEGVRAYRDEKERISSLGHTGLAES